MANIRPSAPIRDPLVALTGAHKGYVESVSWITWLRDQNTAIEAAPQGFPPLVLENLTAAVTTRSIPTDGALSRGLYRVSWFVVVVAPAGVSSQFQVTISWTFHAVTQSVSGSVKNGNSTVTFESGSLPVIALDADTPVTVAVSYASNPGGAMTYNAYVFLERLAVVG